MWIAEEPRRRIQVKLKRVEVTLSLPEFEAENYPRSRKLTVKEERSYVRVNDPEINKNNKNPSQVEKGRNNVILPEFEVEKYATSRNNEGKN